MESDLRVFISYARADQEIADRLYRDLKREGIDIWVDRYNILPGQLWEEEIEKAIRTCRFFIILLSPHSINRRGEVQREIHLALDTADKLTAEEIFIIPVRLEDVKLTDPKITRLQWVNLFPSYEAGLSEILKVILPYKTDIKLPLNEIKLLLVGQGGVGKTSLVNRLVNNSFNLQENMTDGINIRKWWVEKDNQKYRVNIWDFGGQEIMHATHQFF